MSDGQPTRRQSHVDMPVAYAAVGASRAPDLMRFPPNGSTPYEEELRLGSGQDRFLLASSLLMTWGAQRGGGFAVREIERGTGAAYVGPNFDGDGRPQAAGEPEEHFGPDGDPFVVAGTTVALGAPGQPEREVLVVYTISEARSVGFAWGTGDELGPVGEQLFAVELRDDDTVWAVSRGFLAAPKSGLLGLRARAEVRAAIDAVRKQLAALAPGAQPAATQVDEPVQADVPVVEIELADPVPADDADASDTSETSAATGAAEPSDPLAEEAPAADVPVEDVATGAEDAPVADAAMVAEEAPAEDPLADIEPVADVPEQDPETDHAPGAAARVTHQRRPGSARA
ncbi:DUF1990 family protein [Leucobacter luti]|uniref:Uncharacterized protein (UPF0548 family) n=1 Tax=Leucobacter luti TaxID=340320 RepID=A0A4Q7TYP6_9MICO|nr:DUF1990 family protein [Leucobacter luti]MBL3698104.1 DUF1990 family protein [Leucobacter luti]RZT64812.1 uncharacterized protein (UPF0548 family) [Leucobacter luti]